MTLEEKANITLGSSSTEGCSGFTGSVPRLHFPGMCLNDAESGVRTGELVSGYPSQLHVGASWNRDLAGDRAIYIGKEFKTKGVNVVFGPVISPLGKIALGGRNWEGFSNDPYLTGSLVGPTVAGIQQSVIACVKHLVAYEQETNRNPFLVGFVPGLFGQSVSSNLDDRTMHELYLWPFYDAVKSELGSVMCSYQRINNSYACQNSKVMNGLLKTELGFQGFVVSDFYATQTGIAANNAGLDMVMPQSLYLTPSKLSEAVQNGSVNASRLNDQATRIVASWYRYSEVQNPGMNNYANINAQDPASATTIFQSAVEGHVLVKNTKSALPLAKPQTLSLFGYDAAGGLNTSSAGSFFYNFALANTQQYSDGVPFTILDLAASFIEIDPDPHAGPNIALDGTILSGGGSGGITPSYSISPFDAFQVQCAMDKTMLYHDFISPDPQVQTPNDPCIVLINAQSSESWDHSSLTDDYTDALVANVASKCSNTIVVIHNAGIRLVDSWIDHPNITAVMFAHLPGQESGSALVELIYGRQSPSGRLPYTVGKSESDYGSLLGPTFPDAKNPFYPQSDFSEGLFIDYKHFIQAEITPRFAFGYGLTYSNFTYSKLQIFRNVSANTATFPPDRNSLPIPEGGLASLYDILATVAVEVTNTGKVAAAEVAQLYVNVRGSGVPKVLRGFDKHLIQPGKTALFSFPLRRRDLSVWDSTAQQWMLNAGPHTIMVGKSVLDIQLTGTLNM